MRKTLLLVGLAVWTSSVWAVRHIGFETDAFNRAYPASYTGSMVFSPASFEIGCAVIAESLATIPKANVSEMMGVAVDFQSSYRPLLEGLSARTNGFSFVSARGFCVQDLKQTRPDHQRFLERTYATEVMSGHPPTGPESWFRAAMQGEMEDFTLQADMSGRNRFSCYDLVSCKVAWKDPFPTENTRKLAFRPAGETNTVQVLCMSDVRIADTWDTETYTLLKLPLRGDAWFYALLPKAENDLLTVRLDITSLRIDRLLKATQSLTDPGVAHGPCAIVMPCLELNSQQSVLGILGYFRIPVQGLVHVAGPSSARDFVQCVKFRLAEHAWDEPPLLKKAEEDIVPLSPAVKRVIFNRPFLFFVYHEPTQTIPIAGQFTGKE